MRCLGPLIILQFVVDVHGSPGPGRGSRCYSHPPWLNCRSWMIEVMVVSTRHVAWHGVT